MQPLATSKEILSFSSGKQAVQSSLTLSYIVAHFAVRIAAPMENNRFTAAELGKGMLHFMNISTQICRYIEL